MTDVRGKWQSGTLACVSLPRCFRVPVRADEEEARVARAVHVLGWSALVAAGLALVHNAVLGKVTSVGVLGVEQTFLLACLWLNHRELTRAAARLLVFSSIALVASLQASGTYGVHDIAVLIYPIVIVASGVLLDRRWFVLATVIAMVAMAGQFVLELTGVITNSLSRFTAWPQLMDAEVLLLVSAISVELLVGSLRDSMNRSRTALASLRESEALYRTLFESASEAIFLHDAENGAIIDVNHRACELFGYSLAEMRALSVADLSVDAPGNQLADALSYIQAAGKGHSQFVEWQARARDGRSFWVEVHVRAAVVAGVPRVLVSARDVDERRRSMLERQRLEEQLHQAQKMESVGRLAGGVAHDFNNLLTCIVGNVDLASYDIERHHPVAQNLLEIRDAARRASELTRRLLAFSRKQPIEPRPLDVRVLLESSQRMFQRLLGERISLTLGVAAGTHQIHADPNQIEQILMNLVVNARDAMPDGGAIRLGASNADTDDAFLLTQPNARDMPLVRIRVTDTGVGIPADVLPKIFEPFFTTKPVGKGTGLGLSMVFGAVQQNGGFLNVRSIPGNGSTFDIYFPALQAEANSPLQPAQSAILPRGNERVLVVEDDDAVRTMSAQILERLGYRVVDCPGSYQAIAVVEDQKQQFDLLITDVILPGMDGKALAARLCQTLPTIKILYCSGHAADILGPKGVIDGGLAFLAKPYNQEELGNKIRSLLDADLGESKAAEG